MSQLFTLDWISFPPLFSGAMPLVVPFWGSIFVDETVPRHFNSFVLSPWYPFIYLHGEVDLSGREREKQTCFSAKPSKTFLRLHILHAYWFTTMSLWNFYLHFDFNSFFERQLWNTMEEYIPLYYYNFYLPFSILYIENDS